MMKTATRLISSPDAIAAVRPQWDELWARAGGSYVQSPASCLAAWQHILQPQSARLSIAVSFEGDRLVALWPLHLRRRGLWRVLSQVGPMAAEFSNVLVEPGPLARQRVAALWSAVGRASIADLAIVPFVNPATPLGAVLGADRRVVAADRDTAPYVAWREGETWDGYYKSLSASYRKVQNKKRRQLLELGDMRFDVVSDPARTPGLISWMLREKRVWADRANKRGAWLFSSAYEAYLTSLVTERNSAAEFVVFLLSRDDEPVAAQFAMVGPCHVDWILASFASQLARFSPGTILNEHCLKFAHDRGLNVESGAGREENKLFWSRSEAHETVNFRLALSPWGAVGERASRLATQVRARLKQRRPRSGVAAPPDQAGDPAGDPAGGAQVSGASA